MAGTQPLDFSLQVAGGIANFRTWVKLAFPEEAANTTDVPPYKFKTEEPAQAVTDLTEQRRSEATPRAGGNQQFIRGEE